MRVVDGLRGAALVTVDGVIELVVAAGPADVDAGTRCTPDTRFQIASISKQFVAVAALMLAERGAITLDQPVGRWFPDCSPTWADVSVHHLLTHTAGLGHWSHSPGFDVFQPMNSDDRLRLFRQAALRGDPGSRWHYSSPGYQLIAKIVELSSGQPYATFLTAHIIAPLGLAATTAGQPPAGADVARGHRHGKPAPAHDLAAMPGTGDMYSTVADITSYLTHLHTGALLSQESLRILTTAHVPLEGESDPDRCVIGTGYGYGLFTGTIAGHTAYFHPGDIPGFKTFSAWLPQQRASIVLLANDESSDLENLLRQLLPAGMRP